MKQLHVQFFGTFAVTLNGDEVHFEYDKVRALLAFLIIECQQIHRRHVLYGLLWPESDQVHAQQSLNQALYSLRQSLSRAGADVDFVISDRLTVGFNADAQWSSDVERFQQDLLAGHAERDPACKIFFFERAVEGFDDHLLEELDLSDCADWDRWVTMHHERLHRLAVEALQALVDLCLADEDAERALHWAHRLASLDPWREEVHRQILWLLAFLGRRNEGLVYFETCKRMLRESLGMEPSPETVALYEAIRAGELPASPSE